MLHFPFGCFVGIFESINKLAKVFLMFADVFFSNLLGSRIKYILRTKFKVFILELYTILIHTYMEITSFTKDSLDISYHKI